ncbi:kinesin [Penicillium herquei]|nr:kinesin [Penicillium herquei]
MTTSIAFGSDNNGYQVGIHNGTINIHQGQKESPPNPTSNVPFPRDPDFVPRGTLLDEIHAKSSTCPGSWVALVGLGGVGKSQLAIEYCYRVRDQSPDTWAFWMHAGNAARLQEGFQDAADLLKIPNRHDSKANVFKLVHDWLRDNSKWLIILDNLDDADFLHNPSPMGQEGESVDERPLSSFLPRGSNGTLIMTTRTKDATLKLTDNKNIVEIHPMSVSDAADLINKKLDSPVIEMDAQRLAEALGCMPLAIIQATSYVNRQSSSYSVSQYLGEFERNDRRKSKLLDYEAGHSQRDRDAKNSILITWRISFEQIRKINSAAADLLSLMSFFDPHGISEDLLQESTESEDESDDDDDDYETSSSSDSDTDSELEFDSTLRFRGNIAILRDYSFISVREDDQSLQVLSMHPLVQLGARQWLDAHNESDKWRDEFVIKLSTVFPSGEFENWTDCQSLFAHVQLAYTKKPHSDEALRAWGILLLKASGYVRKRGLGTQSDNAEMAEKSVKALKKTCGEEDFNTIASMGNLAATYRHQRRLKEAEALEMKVLDLHKKVLEEDHPKTIVSMGSLAATYRHQRRLKEAEALDMKVLDLHKKVLGEDHPQTIASMGNLAATYRYQRRLKEAEALEMKVLDLRKKVLGEDHPKTIVSMGNLAATYRHQRRLKEAEALEMKVLDLRKKVLGEEHRDTILEMNRIASIWRRSGRALEALDLLRDCVAIQTRVFGPEHPKTMKFSEKLLIWETQQMTSGASELMRIKDSDPGGSNERT